MFHLFAILLVINAKKYHLRQQRQEGQRHTTKTADWFKYLLMTLICLTYF